MSSRLDNKVAVVTGAARGIGATTARFFAREGAKLLLCDAREELLAEVAAEIGGHARRLDVTSSSDWERAIEEAEARFGRVNVFFNNAGIAINNGVEDTTEEEWSAIVAVRARTTLGDPSLVAAARERSRQRSGARRWFREVDRRGAADHDRRGKLPGGRVRQQAASAVLRRTRRGQAGRRAPRNLRRRAVATGSQGPLLRCRDRGHC